MMFGANAVGGVGVHMDLPQEEQSWGQIAPDVDDAAVDEEETD